MATAAAVTRTYQAAWPAQLADLDAISPELASLIRAGADDAALIHHWQAAGRVVRDTIATAWPALAGAFETTANDDLITITGPDAFGYYRIAVDGTRRFTVAPDGTQWAVHHWRGPGSGRWFNQLPDALVAAHDRARTYTRCWTHVGTSVCRLRIRHDGPCRGWH